MDHNNTSRTKDNISETQFYGEEEYVARIKDKRFSRMQWKPEGKRAAGKPRLWL